MQAWTTQTSHIFPAPARLSEKVWWKLLKSSKNFIFVSNKNYILHQIHSDSDGSCDAFFFQIKQLDFEKTLSYSGDI